MILGTHSLSLTLLTKCYVPFSLKTQRCCVLPLNFFIGSSVKTNLDIFPHNWATCFVKKGIYFNYSLFPSKYSSFLCISLVQLNHHLLYCPETLFPIQLCYFTDREGCRTEDNTSGFFDVLLRFWFLVRKILLQS